jgi:putative ABC transport system permease protein
MRRLRALWVRINDAVKPGRRDRDFNEELASHLQLHIDDNIAAGMAPDEARRAAIVKLGGIVQTRERYRDRARLPFVDAAVQDVGYAVRTLRKNPAFALTAILTLALGIGSTTAIFSAVNAVLLQPLPFADQDRLVMIYGVARTYRGVDTQDEVSYPNFVDWRDQAHTLDGAAAYATRPLTVSTGNESFLVRGKLVSPSLFGVLRVEPAIGRSFRPEEEQQGSSRVVILSNGFWKQQLGGDPNVLGRTLTIMDAPFTVVGVMPAGFHIEMAEREQMYTPLPIDTNRTHDFLHVIGRVRRGVSLAQARADLGAVAQRVSRVYPRGGGEGVGANVVPLIEALAGPGRLPLLILFAVVVVVLLVACTNVASLLLARSATRQRELAVRAALGAGRGRLARQLLVESLVIAVAGGAVGLMIADGLARLLVDLVGTVAPVPRLDATRTDAWVLAFTTLVSLATGIAFGVIPALLSASPDLNEALRDAGRSSTGVRAPRLRRGLVVAETALALVLLSGAGVLTRTLLTMRATPPGFDAANLLAADLWVSPTRFDNIERRAQFFQTALARTRALPGVRAASFVADLPLNGDSNNESFHIVGRPDPAPGRAFSGGFNIASAGYFHTMSIPIREGRDFLDSDGPGAPGVVIVNQTAASRFWPDRSAIGQQIDLPVTREKTVRLTVVGVAADVRHVGLAVAPRAEIFVNSMQSDLAWPFAVLVVRAASNPGGLADAVKAALREADPNVPLSRINTVDTVIARSMAQPRVYTLLLSAFAVAAVVLAAVGLYGLIAFSVAQRSHEMGIRAALGASRPELVRLVLGEGVGLAAVGTAIGVAGGLAATRALVGLMAGIQPNDPLTFALVAAMLLTCAALASYVPARRAAAVDPLAALRAE